MNTSRTLRALLVVLLLALYGCPGSGMFVRDAPPTSEQEQYALQAKAAEAWQAGKYERALTLYGFILQGQALTRDAQLIALERSARSALALNRAAEALGFLDTWAKLDSKARNTWTWTEIYVRALSGTGRERQAEEHLAKIIQTRGASFQLTGPASIELAMRYASRDQASQAARALRTQHAKAPDRTERSQFEAQTARMLGALEPRALAAMLATVNNANRNVFPYNLIAFEDLRRLASANPAEASRMRDMADQLARSSDLADRELPRRILNLGLSAATSGEKEAALPAGPEQPAVKPGTTAVAMLLPQTGQLRALAGKVLAGANAAKAILGEQGTQVDIRVINTDDPSFVDQLTALPHEVTIVGGPMHASYFKNLPASGELSRRVFLTFMPDVAEAGEGKQAWRFFWSPEDEVNSVLAIPLQAGVKRFAVLAPEDRMGKRLSDAFASAVTARGGEVSQIVSYPPQDVPRWGDIVKNMVRAVPSGTDGKTWTSRPDFEAVFIPDELQRADHMIGQLHFYQADSLVILGPQLWSASLNAPGNKHNISPVNYRYAFCPGSWWTQSPAKSVAELKARMAKDQQGDPDFWNALGFDFIRLAAGAGAFPIDAPASEITQRLNAASKKMEWALAPITWDAAGHASMNMFFFRPSVEGLAPVDQAGFTERLDALRARQQQPRQ
ncbi:MAG: penicillin-binding protein activator [Thermodesulfobacteriota bacterium]